MTREEEKNKARFEYVSKRLANPDYPTYNDEYELECAYDAGAMWADAHPHWISVEELPKIGKDVLVLREDGEMQVAHQYNEEIARWWSVDGFPLKNNVTHWMPLPIMPVLSNSENTGKDLKGGEK